MKFHLRLIVVSHTVYTILPCGLRAVISIPKIVSPLPVVDHYGVRAIPPFPTFSHRIFAPQAPIRRWLTLVNLSVEFIGEGDTFTMPVRAENLSRAAEFMASSLPGSEVRVSLDGDGFVTDDRSVEELGTTPPAPSAG